MIFYVATDQQGMRQLCTTQAEARAIDKDFVQIDIPTDKPGLRDAIQELLTAIDSKPVSAEPEPRESNPEASEPAPTPIPAQTASQFREMVENQWQEHPLAWRIDLAHQTIEECRKALPWPHKETQTNEQSSDT